MGLPDCCGFETDEFELWNGIFCGFENDGISTVKQTGEQFTIEVLVQDESIKRRTRFLAALTSCITCSTLCRELLTLAQSPVAIASDAIVG